MGIGPQLPPHLAGRSTTPPSAPPAHNSNGSESDDDFGPQLPPHLAAKRKAAAAAAGPQLPSAGPSIPSSSAGPSHRPPGPARPAVVDDSDSDDDFVGPRLGDLAPVQQMSAADEFRAREARLAREREQVAAQPKSLKRDDWMLVPPSSGVLASVNPLQRPTAFNKTSRAAVTADEQSVWTETPAERAQRERDEVAGVKRNRDARPVVEEDPTERKRRRQRDREIAEGVDKHNKSARGPSLLEQHQATKAAKGDDEPPVIWDREKHMGITGRLLSNEERAQKIKDAAGLNDRFGHGKGGAYAM